MKWEKKPLGEIINLKRGYDLPSQNRKKGIVPIISSSGITDFHSEPAKSGEGVVTGRYGTLGQLFYINGDYWPLNTTLYVQDFKGNNPRFIYYFLKTLDLEKFNGASAVPGLDRNVLHKIDVNHLSHLPTQRRIASILSAYDDLIENNLKRIKLLEEKAQLHYKELLQESSKWDKVRLEDFVSVVKGRKPANVLEQPEDDSLLYLLLDTVERTKTLYTSDLTLPLSKETDVLMCMDGARSGLAFRGMNGAIGSTMAIWRSNSDRVSGEFLYQFMKQNESAIIQGNTGAAIPHANRKFILDMKLAMPPKKEAEYLDGLTLPIIKLIDILHIQNTKLREARDILLHKLMNGQIQV
jgi:type I restriction enzyme S subunit